MKVKIGDKIYDSEKEPIVVVLSDSDKMNITNMLPHCTKYCSFPNNCAKYCSFPNNCSKEDIERL